MCDGVQSTETKLEGVSVSEFPFGNARTSCGLTEISQPKRTQNPRDVLEKQREIIKILTIISYLTTATPTEILH